MKRLFLSITLIALASTATADTVIKTFSGNGIHITRPFTVPDGWEVQWVNLDFLQIFVQQIDEDRLDMAANQITAGNGSSYQPIGGRYYLKINGVGDWVVKVVKVD